MPSFADLKAKASALEVEGNYPGALDAFRTCLGQLEGTPEFLKELPTLVRIGDLEIRTGDETAAVASYERAIGFYIRHGRAESVIATGLRLTRIRPGATPFLDYTTRLLGAGFPKAARKVLVEVMLRTGHPAEAGTLQAVEGAPDAEIVAAVEHVLAQVDPRVERDQPESDGEYQPHPTLSLGDAIAEMRRQSGLAERASHPDFELLPSFSKSRRRPRRRTVPLLLAVVLVVGATAAFFVLRQRTDAAVVRFANPPTSPGVIPAVAETPVVQSSAPAPRERMGLPSQPEPGSLAVASGPSRPGVALGLFAPDPGGAALLSLVDRADVASADTVVPAVELPGTPRLPEGAVVTRAVVAVRGLPITRINDAGSGYRLTQPLPGGGAIELTLSPFPGAGASTPRVTTVGSDQAAGSLRFQGYMVNARAPVSPDRLRQFLLRLVVVQPRH